MAKAKRKTKAKTETRVKVSRKAPSKKTKVKKSTTRKATVKKVKTTVKLPKSSKPYTKSQQASFLSEVTGGTVSKKDASFLLEAFRNLIVSHLKGPGTFTIPGVCKFKLKRKPATKARKGINPFTGEPTIFKAKPAKNVIKILPLKGIKDEV